MRIVVLAGGVGGARFLRGLKAAAPDAEITVIGNTGDDINLFGLQVCPDLDTVMYTLGGGIHEEQGWGRAEETLRGQARSWPPTASARTGSASATGTSPPTSCAPRCSTPATRSPRSPRRCAPAGSPGVRLLPMTDDRVETHVVVDDPEDGTPGAAVHFQEYWVRLHAAAARARRSSRSAPSRPSRRRACWRRSPTPTWCCCRRPTRSSPSARSWPCPGIREAHRRRGRAGGRPVPDHRRRPGARHGRQGAGRGRRGGHRRGGRRHYGAGLLDGWLVDTVDAAGSRRSRRPGSAAARSRC